MIAFESNLIVKMRSTDTMIYALDEEIKDKVEAHKFQKWLHNIFKDKEMMRKIQYLSQLKSNVETSIEYYGFDYASSPDYHFDEDTEIQINKIEQALSLFLGKVMKHLGTGKKVEI